MSAISGFVRNLARCQLNKKLSVAGVQARWLNLQEYQSKRLMADNDIAVQKFGVVSEATNAAAVARDLNVPEIVVKAQILAGGRGKGMFDNGFKGGVHLTKDPEKVAELVEKMVGHRLHTKQTPQGGVQVNQVMIAHALDIARETYFAILMDREYNGPVMVGSPMGGVDIEDVAHSHPDQIFKVERYFAILMDREYNGLVMVGSPMGGVDIEEVAHSHPDQIFKEPIDIMTGLTYQKASTMATNLGFTGSKQQLAAEQITRLYELFLKVDATQVEINPFGETDDGNVVCFDAKMNFDDNAAFRQKDIFTMDDKSESDWREVEADKHNLNYIGMDGNIGCLVNGAGLAMATMDIIKHHGGEPANFLDVREILCCTRQTCYHGGSIAVNHNAVFTVNGAGLAMATMDIIKHHGGEPANFLDVGGNVNEDQVYNAFKLLSADKQVKSILVNVFAGIVNCVTIANGIKNACQNINMTIPIIVRLEGNSVDQAKKILEESNLPILTATSLQDAAQKAVDSLTSDSSETQSGQ